MSRRVLVTAALTWIALLGLSLALSVAAATHPALPGDTRILSWTQDLPFPGQTLADAVRSVTSTQIALAAGGALALLLWLRGFRRQAVVLAAGLVLLPLLQAGIKEIVDRPRPSPDLVEIRASFSSPSFPSGHVMSPTYLYGFVLYFALSSHLPPAARASLAGICVAVLALSALASVWLGVHWPSDVLGGYAWGSILLLPSVIVCRWFSRQA
jgi:membrane-associated phospholipid phosphatase